VADAKSSSPSGVFRFGVFQANLAARELRNHGVRVRLPGQPFCILSMLLEKPGEVVTREEMRQRLWASDTFVDFEHSLNTAIKKLRAALNDTPENSRYVETLPRLGYRFVAPVEVISAKLQSVQEAPVATIQKASPVSARESQRHWLVLLSVSVILISMAAGYFASRARVHSQPTGQRWMLAVLPFENLTGDLGQEYFSDGLTEEMIAQLGRLNPEHLGVIARTSVMHYKNSRTALDQIGRELGVQYVLEGSVRRDADKVRISAQLIQLKDQTRVWSRQYDRDLSGLLTLQAEIAREISNEIRLTLGDDSGRIAADRKPPAPPTSYEAFDLYLKGRYFWNKRTKEGFQQAAQYFQQAIDRDPNFARAYAGLADTFGLMSTWSLVPHNEFMPKAREAALKALQNDESIAEAHTSLALISESYDYDWQTAEKEFKRAIQLDPGYATAHQWYAECLSWQGRFEEALAESQRARQLDPLSLIIAADYGVILYYSRQYDRAIAQSRAVLDMDPSFERAHYLATIAYVEKGMFAEALAETEKWRQSDGTPLWDLQAYVYGRQGQLEHARQALAKWEQWNRGRPVARSVPLAAYVAVGRKEESIARLQQAYSEHSNAVTDIKVAPYCDPLRSDPRFQDLLRRVGLADTNATRDTKGGSKPLER
jgi:TolB-like protein/DNA-binding winged helix-turn-helix (wHTH) protein/Tfp pilus assembly protein PilF